MENVRIAIRDSTDSHNVAFFDNISGIRYQSANLQRFLAGSASILTIDYNSKDIDTIRTGCKLAFIYKDRPYWLNIMGLSKKGYKVEITAYSLGLELNQEERGAHKPANAMSFAEFLAYYDPEHALELGINEVADKRIKLEWTGTDTILARLFSIANSFDAELEFTVELNQDYSLKRQVLNVYKKGNLCSNRAASPIRVGRGLKVINYSDNLKELRTAVRATGKDGLTLDGFNKKIYDDDGNLLYYSNANTVYAPQSRDKYPSVGKKSNDNWIIKELGETEYSTKEALWGYMLGELKKICVPEITYDIEGAINGDVGDTRTLIDDVHYDPPLYVQARISELTEDLITGKVTKSTFINFERKYSQIADELQKRVEALAEDAAPYIVRLSTDNGFNFKNGQGSSTITAKLEKYSKIVNADWKWLINNSVVSETSSVTINASQVTGTLNVVAVASVDGNEVAREYITFTNSDDGVGIKSIKRYYTTNEQAEGVTAGGQNWATKPTTVTADKKYMWSYDVITYTNDTSLVTEPAVIGARGDDGLDADTTGITEALDKAKQELSALSANLEKVRDDSLAAVNEAKQKLATVADDLSKAKTDLQNAVSAVDTKATNLQSDLTKAKQDLTSQANQLQAQASAQADLTSRVSTVEETANGTKSTVGELTKTVAQNGKDITSVTARTKTVEDDLANTKTTLTATTTTANSASQKTATLESGLNGLTAKFENLKIGSRNYFKDSKSRKYYINSTETQDVRTFIDDDFWKNDTRFTKDYVRMSFDIAFNPALPTDFATNVHFSASPWYNCGGITFKGGTTALQHFDLKFNLSGAGNSYKTDNVFIRLNNTIPLNTAVSLENFKLYLSAVVEDYSRNETDIESKVAEYKQTADQNYASLQTTVQNLDGTVQQNKTTAEQTAQGFKTRIESLETYKDGETTRANQYFESAKTETARQLTAERTAIAKDYVAKSTYTSDVTGIRNDLTATTTTANTTKTNLANYQASNDKVVANLQSNLQTANGNISSLQTKIEAVPGQITSAVSAVEGKIPTNVSTRNLILKSNDFANPHKQSGANTTVTSTNDYFVIKSAGYTANAWGGMSWNMSISEMKAGEEFSILMPVYIDSSISLDNGWSFNIKNHSSNSAAYDYSIPTNKKDQWFNVAITFKAYNNVVFDTYPFYVYLVKNGLVRIKPPMLVRGNLIPSDWQPAPEDTATQISNLSSQIKQTADGMTLLATKTELSTAKSDLQSGITTATNKANTAQSTADSAVTKANVAQSTANSNAQTISTHTTQISALNTGLQAKVSKSDFNTLSGRVATAENNITATANELSSKITSVEGKIPTSIDTVNLIKGTGSAFVMGFGITNTTWDETKKQSILDFSISGVRRDIEDEILPQGNGIFDFKPIKGTTYTQSIMIDTDATFNPNGQAQCSWFTYSGGHNQQKAYIKQIGQYSYQVWSTYTWNSESTVLRAFDWYNLHNVLLFRTTGTYLAFYKPKLTTGNLPSDWSPSPEDYDSKLATAQSEIKQTTDSITASVSSVETKANTAQSTANTAVSKADAAQSGVNALNETTVKSASLNLDNNGFVTKVGKTVNGNTFATMIAQDENDVQIIAKKMKVSSDMIVNGAITAEKLNVSNLSAVNSNLGKIEGGSLLLQENKAASSSIDSWGTFNRPAHKQGLYMDNRGLASSGAIQRKNGGETTPTDMPLAVLQSGELRFLVVDYNDNLEDVLHHGLSDPDFGAIRFEIDSELKRRLTMTSSGYLNFQATNYTNWTSTGVSGCEYMIQGRLVLVNYDVTFNSAGTHTIGGIPQEFTKKSLMMTAKAWTITPRDKNIQLNSDGTLHILDAEANVNYRGTLVFSY
ncbi:Chromosome partition protein Smc [Streptococcus infantarius subsp. infantarius]|nr:Chromosome partition protein Smc [Streptococcus infantarius subsp. infantarius]